MPRVHGSQESTPELCGVPGRMFRLGHKTEPRFLVQKWTSEGRPWRTSEGRNYGPNARLHAVIRFDDECGNGQNSFAITAKVSRATRHDDNGGIGCHHEAIARVFPEFAHLIKWHLCDTRGPLHGAANAIYHAGDRDHNGLRAGEFQPIRNGRTGKLSWELVPVGTEPGDSIPLHRLGRDKVEADSADDLPPVPVLEWRQWGRIGEGKARDLDAARSCAVWPDAPDSVLMLERDELRPILEARIPQLVADFRADLERAGLAWVPAPGAGL